MSKTSLSDIKGLFGIFLGVIIFCFALILGYSGFFNRIELLIYDWCLKTKINNAPMELNPLILPVDLNDRAERNLDERLDSREAFADLFHIFKVAEQEWIMELVVGMDFRFPRYRDSESDKRMAENAGQMSGLVLAVVPVPDTNNFSGNQLEEGDLQILRRHLWHPKIKSAGNIPGAMAFLVSNQQLMKNCVSIGHIGMESPVDGIYRKVPLFYRWEDGYIPSLPLAMAAAYYKINTNDVIIDAGRELIIPRPDGMSIKIPIDKEGKAWIPFAAKYDNRNRVPLDTISDAVKDEGTMNALINSEFEYDSFILACDTTTGQKDFGITAFAPVYPLAGVHENVLNSILTGQFYKSTPGHIRFMFLCLSFILVSFAFYRKNDIVFHLSYALALCIHIALTCLLWFNYLFVPWFAIPAFAIFCSWLAAFTLRLLKARENRLLLTEAMTRYFPRSLAEKILAENKTDLVPASKEVSILFADIKGFTNWSSEKEAATVHSFLSDYLESMAGIIFECGGTVDKFLGDGILAFFGDPYEQPDHTDRCIRAAIAMQKKAGELAVKWKPLVDIDLKIRIGINSGQVIVGNLGTKARIEYTVIGAAVNLAQRMESNAPVGGVLVAPDAKARSSGGFRFQPFAVQVKGYDKPIEAFVLEI